MKRLLTIGDRIKEERNRLGFNQEDFAELAGLAKTKAAQSNYENGHRAPNADYLARLDAAGADIFYIITGKRVWEREVPLSPDELEMLELYRAAKKEIRAAARRVLSAEE